MTKTAAESCRQQSDGYHRQFPDCPTMTSTELAGMMNQRSSEIYYKTEGGSPVHLIDVRSAPEMGVSIIPGSVSLLNFEKVVAPNLSGDAIVVCYCTVGYRSGIECRRLKEKYGLEKRVRNLDGIVAYTHAVHEASRGEDSGGCSPHLVNGITGETCNKVHVFGPQWDCASESYRTIKFSFVTLVTHYVQVGVHAMIRTSQHVAYIMLRAFNFTRQI